MITLDELPSNVVAGEPLSIGFTVLQHGRTPMTDIRPTVTAQLADTEKMVIPAEPKGNPGHYVATLTFPKEGNWEWSIQAFTMDQRMPVLNVATASAGNVNQPVVKTTPADASISPVLISRALALAIGLLWLSTVPPTQQLVAIMFGTRYMATLFGFVFFSHPVGSFLGAWLGGRLYDASGSYDSVWWISIALGIFAAIVHLPIRETRVARPAMV